MTGFAEDATPFPEPATSVEHMRLKIDRSGRVLIPAEMRAAMMLDPDGFVTASVKDGALTIISPLAAVRQLQAYARRFIPEGELISEELIAERREEAARE